MFEFLLTKEEKELGHNPQGEEARLKGWPILQITALI